MTIQFSCPSCSTRITAGDQFAGKRAKCKKCLAVVQVPTTAMSHASKPATPAGRTAGASSQSGESTAGDARKLQLKCPHCETRITAAIEFAGNRAKCKKCLAVVVVPAPQAKSSERKAASASKPAGAATSSKAAATTTSEGRRSSRVTARRQSSPSPSAAPQTESSKVRFACPHCDVKITAGIEYAGKRAKCRSCGAVVVVPAQTSSSLGQHVASSAKEDQRAIALRKKAASTAAAIPSASSSSKDDNDLGFKPLDDFDEPTNPPTGQQTLQPLAASHDALGLQPLDASAAELAPLQPLDSSGLTPLQPLATSHDALGLQPLDASAAELTPLQPLASSGLTPLQPLGGSGDALGLSTNSASPFGESDDPFADVLGSGPGVSANPYASPAAPRKQPRTAKPSGGNRGGYRGVSAGLNLVLMGVIVALVGVGLMFVIGMIGVVMFATMDGRRGPPTALLMGIGAFAMLAQLCSFASGILSLVGRIFCLSVPRPSEAKAFIVIAVVIDVLVIGAVILSATSRWWATADVSRGMSLAVGLLGLLSMVFFLLFIRSVCNFLGERRLGDIAMQLIMMGIGVMVGVPVMFTIGSVFGSPVLLLVVSLAMLVIGIWMLIAYIGLLASARELTARR